MSLNEAQKEAVAHYQGPCLVLAGPGSGKTLTIAKRIEYLIKVYKVRPEEILVITFTKYASNEMKRRFQGIMKSVEYPVNFGTFHSVYYWILKWAYGLNQTNILSENEKYALLRQAVKGQEEEELFDISEEDYYRGLAEEIGNVKNNLENIETYESTHYGKEKFRCIYQMYEGAKRKLKKIDFEDMLVMCRQLFVERKDILKKWQEKFRYILIDEFQDINQVQYDVIRMLAEPENNLFAVGDDDQSIYGFRGAKPGIMMEFKKDYPEAKQILLDINYRSGAHIVNGALRVIGNNRKRYDKKIRPWKKAEKTVHIQEVKDPVEESEYILNKIEETIKEGVPDKEIAVLFRTTMDARILTETLAEHRIPFQMKEKLYNIYDHFSAQDIISYIRISQKEYEKKYFLRIANRPNRYIGRDSMSEGPVTYESLRNFYCDKLWMQDRIDQLEWDMKMISGKTPYAAIQYIRKSIGYDEFLKEYAGRQRMNYSELAETLDKIQESSKGYRTISEWLLHVERYGELLREKAASGRMN
ncbi:MAG: ATP-dependent helicase, partial [Lachnospiraceae bacterium]